MVTSRTRHRTELERQADATASPTLVRACCAGQGRATTDYTGSTDVSAATWAGACCDESKLCQPNAKAAATCAQQTGGDEGCGLSTSGTCEVDPDHNGATTTIWDWLNQLNVSTFAGFNDWRNPIVRYATTGLPVGRGWFNRQPGGCR